MNQNEPDYEAVEIPDNEDPADYHYTVRRAEILQAIKRRGNPYAFNRRQLADRYDVHPSNITRDFHRLADYVKESIGDGAMVTARTAMEKAVKQAQDEGEHVKAFYIALEWAQFLQSIGVVDRAPMKADVTVNEAPNESDEYILITDDDEIESMTEPPALESESDQE